MRAFTLLLALFLPACLDEAPPALDEAAADQATFTNTPIDPNAGCPDIHADLPGDSIDCVVPHGGGLGKRLCTDHVTFHFIRLISTTGPVCVQTTTTTTTTCGECLALTLPGGGL